MSSGSQGAAGPSRPQAQEITVVVSRERKKRVTIMQLPNETAIDKNSHVTLARENNLREYKSAYNIDLQPTTGAGSEFGREAKEEARRRKFGYIRKNYNPEAQPWLMQLGAEKNARKMKGTRNGGILENASYFIFSKRPDGLFEATPVEEWFSFKPTISYKNLNAEEAEEEFAKRDKNLNLFNVMVRKRLKKEDEQESTDSKEKVKKEVKSKGLMLTEMEDWADISDEDDGDNKGGDSDSSMTGGKKGGKGKGKGRKKKKEVDSDEEAVEDSDDGDMEAKQVDYMSDTSESDSDADLREDKSKYEEKGVVDEEGLRDIVVESESEEEKETEKEKEKAKGSASSSSSSESESDDPDREGNEFTKAFLMSDSKKERGKSPVPRSATPTDDRKRKQTASPVGSSPSTKRIKQEPGGADNSAGTSKLATTSNQADGRPTTPLNSAQASRDGLTDDSVRRYLMRKPMTSKDLFKIFKSKKLGLSSEDIANKITVILKRINPAQQKINGVVYFSIKE